MKRVSTTNFRSSAWDRLMATPASSAVHDAPVHLTIEQFKRVIARDLEALLNSRVAFPDVALAGLPNCKNSIINFGLTDFAELCLTNSEDRKEICNRLKAAIERHERRLTSVRVSLATGTGAINRLSFVVSGQLRALGTGERTQFDVELEPSSLHYAIS